MTNPGANVGLEMASETAAAIRHMQATFDYLGDDWVAAEANRNWLIKQVRDMVDTLTPADLTIVELSALTAILGPPFSRVIGSPEPPDRTVRLRVV